MESYKEFFCMTGSHYRPISQSVIIHDAKGRPRRECELCNEKRIEREELAKMDKLA